MKINLDFYIHWIWSLTFGLLSISGFALMGARYGWVMNYDLATADFLHRSLAALFAVLLVSSILIEILRLTINLRSNIWMMVGPNEYQFFTVITTLLLIVSGLIIWVCMGFSMKVTAFALLIHEWVSFLTLGSVIWHIYEKAHAIRDIGEM